MMNRVLFFVLFSILTNSALYSQETSLEDMLKTANEGIKNDPNNQYYYKARADIYTLYNKFDKAIEDYSMAIKLNSNYTEAHYYRGLAFHKDKQFENALKDIEYCFEHNFEQKSELLYNRGVIYQDLQEYNKAIEDYDKLIALDNTFSDAYYNKGIIYLKLDELSKAILNFDKAILINNTDPIYFINRGYVYYKKLAYEEAIRDFENTLKLDSTYYESYKWLGFSYQKLGDKKNANINFEKAKKHNVNLNED